MERGLTKELAIRALKLHKAMPKELHSNIYIHLKNKKELDTVRKLMNEFNMIDTGNIIRTKEDKYF